MGRPRRSQLATLHYTLPTIGADHARRRRSPAGVVAGSVMIALAVWLVVQNDMFRAFEARMVTPVAALVVGGRDPVRVSDTVYFALGTSRRFGLQLTDECTSALLLIPLLVMMGCFAIFSRLSLRRQLLAVLSGACLIVAVNIARTVLIAYSTWRWGIHSGYEYSHVFIGSAFSLVGFVGAMLLALWMLVRRDRPKRAVAFAAEGVSAGPAVLGRVGRRRVGRGTRAAAGVGGAGDEPAVVEPAADSDVTFAAEIGDHSNAQVTAARAELFRLRETYEGELAHLRDRFDHHLVSAQERERRALDRSAALETALEQAKSRLAEAESQSAESQPAQEQAEVPVSGTGTETPAVDAGRHAYRTPSPDDLRDLLADVQDRIAALAERVHP